MGLPRIPLLLLMITSPALALLSSEPDITEAIIGGQFASPGMFPHHVYFTVMAYGKYNTPESTFCGASLISTTRVLTAAHCVHRMVPGSGVVMAGSIHQNQPSSSTQRGNVTRVHIHTEYHPMGLGNDIAVLEINPPLKLNQNVGVIKILRNDLPLITMRTAVISGFGLTAVSGRQPVNSDQLRYVYVDLYHHNYCRQQWVRQGMPMNYGQICAGGRDKGAGPGDSGGPLVVYINNRIFQIGLTSYGPDPERQAHVMLHYQDYLPVVYTRVAWYCNFIEQYAPGTCVYN
ncbi:hypothetical protein QR680_011264 [Steinernema hermaphroditum]|uniref:Peptidase S1 domain-containing protein n=1 Tax=Steinernema hermaphroditum TaxID=289476 RepID=A0AA39IU59_9BILA|nr:hypothetical protein QR680_011264 [Steinernema hermaphroditum]